MGSNYCEHQEIIKYTTQIYTTVHTSRHVIFYIKLFNLNSNVMSTLDGKLYIDVYKCFKNLQLRKRNEYSAHVNDFFLYESQCDSLMICDFSNCHDAGIARSV